MTQLRRGLRRARAGAAAVRSARAARRETAAPGAPPTAVGLARGRVARRVGWPRSEQSRAAASAGQWRSARRTRAAVSRVLGASIGAGLREVGRLWALCNALCNALHSARPLIPGVVRGWWGAWIRPRPPHVHSSRERSGSDPGPPRSGGEGSADGRKRSAGTEEHRDKTDRRTRGAAAATEAITAKGEERKTARSRARGSEVGERRTRASARQARRARSGEVR